MRPRSRLGFKTGRHDDHGDDHADDQGDDHGDDQGDDHGDDQGGENHDENGLQAHSHHDKFPPWWVFVRDDYGGNLSVTKSLH